MNVEHRLHPLYMLFQFGIFLKDNFFIILVLFILNFQAERLVIKLLQLAFLLYFIAQILHIIIKWATYKYTLSETSIYIKEGLFKKTQQTVPINKIQNTHRQTTVIHKLLKVTSLTLETGVAGTDSSLKFDCLSIKEAERIELITLNKIDFATFSLENNQDSQGANDRNGQVRTLHYKPTTKELLKASFVSFSFLAIIPFIFTIYDYVSEFYNVKAHRDEFLEVMLQSYWVFSLIIVFFILAAIVFGIIRTFLKYGKYEILSDEEKIYINKGIWKEISFSIQKNKVQAIQIQQSFLKRLLKIAEVKIISSGSSGELENQTNSLFPFMPVNQIQSVLKELLPDYKIDTAMHTLPKKSLFLRLIRPSYIWLIVSTIIFIFKPELWHISILHLLLLIFLRIIDFKNSKYFISEAFIQLKSGSIWSTLLITKRSKVIEIELEQSILQKPFHVATIQVVNHSKPLLTISSIMDVPLDFSTEFYHWYMNRKLDITIEQP